MLKSINLSISSACGGNCLFCPSNRGSRIKEKIMPLELAKKIVDEVASQDFTDKHMVERFIIGENGDAFLNEDIIEILRYIKLRLPEKKVWLITNFFLFFKDKAEIILKEDLIDFCACNIDGSNEANYSLIKGKNFETVKKNVINYLEIRKKLNSESTFNIGVITFNRYIKTIRKNFGFYPGKLKDHKHIKIPDDFAVIKNQWEKLLDPKKDRIDRQTIFGWAERDKIGKDIDYRKYSCRNLERVKEEAFIAPDGTWYACCYDSNNELALGNVALDGINRIYDSLVRENLIKMLEKKEFDKIDGPCKTVICCQALYLEPELKKILKKFLRVLGILK